MIASPPVRERGAREKGGQIRPASTQQMLYTCLHLLGIYWTYSSRRARAANCPPPQHPNRVLGCQARCALFLLHPHRHGVAVRSRVLWKSTNNNMGGKWCWAPRLIGRVNDLSGHGTAMHDMKGHDLQGHGHGKPPGQIWLPGTPTFYVGGYWIGSPNTREPSTRRRMGLSRGRVTTSLFPLR